jgi:hypothetical protein
MPVWQVQTSGLEPQLKVINLRFSADFADAEHIGMETDKQAHCDLFLTLRLGQW